MKAAIPTLLLSTVAIANPTRRDAYDTSTDMDEVIAGRKSCSLNALFKEALVKELNGAIHVQGVNEVDYPANLDDYVREGGSEACADACANTVDLYAEKCPEANIFVVGWSQGALCAHECVNRINTNQLAGLIVFGSENALMDDPSPIPASLPYAPYCNEDNISPDLLCTSTWTSGIGLPTSLGQLTSMVQSSLKSLASIATNEAQRHAAAQLPLDMASGFMANAGYFAGDLLTGNVRRWLVLLPHFEYATKRFTAKAAMWVAERAKAQ